MLSGDAHGPASHLTRLLAGGVIGAHAAAAATVGVLLWGRGVQGAVSAAVAAVIVLLFFVIGHAVQLRYASATPQHLLIASLASYGIRVTALGTLLWVALENPELPVDASAVGLSAIATVFGWVAGEIVAFRRLRIPVFDPPTPQEPAGESTRNRV